MNETMSLLLATTILAFGGLGLMMYKSSDDSDNGADKQNGGDEYNEDTLFGSKGGFWWGSSEEDEVPEEVEKDPDVVESKVRSRGGAKTKRNRKSVGSKRRY